MLHEKELNGTPHDRDNFESGSLDGLGLKKSQSNDEEILSKNSAKRDSIPSAESIGTDMNPPLENNINSMASGSSPQSLRWALDNCIFDCFDGIRKLFSDVKESMHGENTNLQRAVYAASNNAHQSSIHSSSPIRDNNGSRNTSWSPIIKVQSVPSNHENQETDEIPTGWPVPCSPNNNWADWPPLPGLDRIVSGVQYISEVDQARYIEIQKQESNDTTESQSEPVDDIPEVKSYSTVSTDEKPYELNEAYLNWSQFPDVENVFGKTMGEVISMLELEPPMVVNWDDPIHKVSCLMKCRNKRGAVVATPVSMPTILEDASQPLKYDYRLIDFNDISHAILTDQSINPIGQISNLRAGDIMNCSQENEAVICTEEDALDCILTNMKRKKARRAVIFTGKAQIGAIFNLHHVLKLFTMCPATMQLLRSLPINCVPRQEKLFATQDHKIRWAYSVMATYKHSSLAIVSKETGEALSVLGLRDLDTFINAKDGDKLFKSSVGDFLEREGFHHPLGIDKSLTLDVVAQRFLDTMKARLVLIDETQRCSGMISSSALIWTVWPLLLSRIEEQKDFVKVEVPDAVPVL